MKDHLTLNVCSNVKIHRGKSTLRFLLLRWKSIGGNDEDETEMEDLRDNKNEEMLTADKRQTMHAKNLLQV